MTQKSLVYVVLAVAVGYILVSAVPQQVATYTTPQDMLLTSEKSFSVDEVPQIGEGQTTPDSDGAADNTYQTETIRVSEDPSFLEASRLPELMKWWTLDVIIAVVIYWVARRSLS